MIEKKSRGDREQPKEKEMVRHAVSDERPGALQGEASVMLLHTRQAVAVAKGRKEVKDTNGVVKVPKIFGLFEFGTKVNLLWLAAKADDPYADWWLIKISEAIDDAGQQIERMRQEADGLLAAASQDHEIKITLPRSSRPVEVPLKFNRAYGYAAAFLIADYDRMVRHVQAARHHHLMRLQRADQLIEDGAHRIRSVLGLPYRWTHLSITRDDVRQGTQRASKAAKMMGELPQEVLDASKRAEGAPVIDKSGRALEQDPFTSTSWRTLNG